MAERWRTLAQTLVAVLAIACSSSQAPAPTIAASPTTGAAIPLRVLVTRIDGGTPVAGATVCAGRASSASPSCTTAGADGAATLFGSPGTYFVRIGGPAELRWQDATRVVDLAGDPAALWVELQPVHRISGTIRDDDGAKITGAQACAHAAIDDATVCARSAADG